MNNIHYFSLNIKLNNRQVNMYVYIQVQLNPQNFFKALNASSILVTSI